MICTAAASKCVVLMITGLIMKVTYNVTLLELFCNLGLVVVFKVIYIR